MTPEPRSADLPFFGDLPVSLLTPAELRVEADRLTRLIQSGDAILRDVQRHTAVTHAIKRFRRYTSH